MRTIKRILLFVVLTSLLSCEKKPTACIALDDTLEAGTLLSLESCSEDFEFLTWEYSDGVGNVGDVSQRSFQEEGTVAVRVTAYSDGAYRSDYADQTFDVSYRYVDYFEITGNSAYDSMRVDLGNNQKWKTSKSEGEFTDVSPLVIQSWPEREEIIDAESQSLTLYGLSSGIWLPLVSKKFNFFSVKDNPTIVESEDSRYVLKMYWTFREI